MRYRPNAREVDALLFDGTAESAAAISRRFGTVAHDGSRLEVYATGGRVFAGAGCWIVRDRATRRLSVVDGRIFSAQFEVVDDPRLSVGVIGGPAADRGASIQEQR